MAKQWSPALSANLTGKDAGFVVATGKGKVLGAVVRATGGKYVAWAGERLGEYETAIEAELAVRGRRR